MAVGFGVGTVGRKRAIIRPRGRAFHKLPTTRGSPMEAAIVMPLLIDIPLAPFLRS